MSLRTRFRRIELVLADEFTIARGSTEVTENVIVEVTDDAGVTGVGGCSPSLRYGETVETVEAVLPDLLEVVESVGDPHQLSRIGRLLHESVHDNPAARAGISIALHDLVAKRFGVPLYRYFGLDHTEVIETSYTIGIDSIDRVVEKTEAAIEGGYGTLKVKLGTDPTQDLETISAIREVAPEATIRVDANEGWSTREAIDLIDELSAYAVEFVEQPVPAERYDALRFVHDRAALPIAVDESCVSLTDIPLVSDRTDIVNIKLMKSGGLREAVRMIHAAKAHGLEVMLGCMIESNASIAAACHLTPMLDYADLDGSLLLAQDPYSGVSMPRGRIELDQVTDTGTAARVCE